MSTETNVNPQDGIYRDGQWVSAEQLAKEAEAEKAKKQATDNMPVAPWTSTTFAQRDRARADSGQGNSQ